METQPNFPTQLVALPTAARNGPALAASLLVLPSLPVMEAPQVETLDMPAEALDRHPPTRSNEWA
jgi:hypothetical protein